MKHLILKYIETVDNIVRFSVLEQSHREFEFSDNGSCKFLAQNGFYISSVLGPAVYRKDKLYVRGSIVLRDSDMMITSIIKWERIKEAVQEYNYYYEFTGQCILGEIPEPILPEELFTL